MCNICVGWLNFLDNNLTSTTAKQKELDLTVTVVSHGNVGYIILNSSRQQVNIEEVSKKDLGFSAVSVGPGKYLKRYEILAKVSVQTK